MNLSKYRCVVCEQGPLRAYTTYWQCEHCGEQFPTVRGVPKLYREASLGSQDRTLRDSFYNGFLGRYYQQVMPFLALPVRPNYWGGWLAYAGIVAGLMAAIVYVVIAALHFARTGTVFVLDVVVALFLVAAILFLLRQKYLLYLLLLAVPVKLSLAFTRFKPSETFPAAHARLIGDFLKRHGRLHVLDISTGSCNSLYRHGWMKLDADYTGLDLSETMLFRGVEFMTRQKVPMDFVLGDAARLPFTDAAFDVVLNYGALNGYTDSKQALAEMARVTKPQGLVLVFDEQLYESASFIENLYFRRVLSGHDVIHRCPVDAVPNSLERVEVQQIYHFYYLLTAFKK